MKQTKPTQEDRRRLGLAIEHLRNSADTATEVLAGKYPEDAAGYLLGCIINAQAELKQLVGSRRSRAA